MDNSNHPNTNQKKSASSCQLGMNSFNAADREQFGQHVRLAMACIEGKTERTNCAEQNEHTGESNQNALPLDAQSIRQRLKLLSQELSAQHADLLELLVRFDDQQAWKQSGASHCAAWMNAEIGISTKLSWEYLRVGRRLQSLPTLQALFRVGKLSWSKVRLITRVADSDNEKTLCHAALDASVSEVKRPTINGAGPIGRETARRIACDCSISVTNTRDGEPIDIGRKSCVWPSAMARAIKERDQQCVWPGCDHSRHLHIHHIQHWADGGSTSVENGVCLCSYHHTLVHEGGYKIEAVAHDKDGVHKQFFQQLNFHDLNQYDFEESLRNDRDSFTKIRQLSPERFRFRIMDKNGHDITNATAANTSSAQKIHDESIHSESTRIESASFDSTQTESTRSDSINIESANIDSTRIDSIQIDPICHSTHWQCKEPPPATYCA